MTLHSYDEWSQLKEVIVGNAENYTSHDRELSFDLFFHDNLKSRSEWRYPRLSPRSGAQAGKRERYSIKPRYLEELNEDVEGIAETLTSLGVEVHRPARLDPSTVEVTTLAWTAAVVPPLNVRDIALIVGDEVIETPPMLRSRYFETQFLKSIFSAYFQAGARWTVMPRPLMTDRSFDPSYALSNSGGPMEPISDPQPHAYDVGLEMMWDGAQCLRLGRDLVVNISTDNHAQACDWLERHLEGRFRIHRVYRLSDSHIDSKVLALAPGRLLVRSSAVAEYLPKMMRSWDMIVAPDPVENNFPEYDNDDLVLTSPYIDLNVLSVAPDLVLVNEACPDLMRVLEKHQFNVVPVRHRHRRLFGGGFHCFTLDTVREAGAEDYLT